MTGKTSYQHQSKGHVQPAAAPTFAAAAKPKAGSNVRVHGGTGNRVLSGGP